MDVLCGTQGRHAPLISHSQLRVSQHQPPAENTTRYSAQTGRSELTVTPRACPYFGHSPVTGQVTFKSSNFRRGCFFLGEGQL